VYISEQNSLGAYTCSYLVGIANNVLRININSPEISRSMNKGDYLAA
jgi:hypothetical protein